MEKKSYSDKLKDPRWQKKRLEIFNRDGFSCRMCGDNKTTLCIHHLKYSGNPWDVDNEHLVTLCEDCHAEVELLISEGISYENIDVTKAKSEENKVLIIRANNIIGLIIMDSGNKKISEFSISNKVIDTILKYKSKINGRLD